TDPRKAKALADQRVTSTGFTQWKVRLLVNNAKSDGPELIEQLDADDPTSAGEGPAPPPRPPRRRARRRRRSARRRRWASLSSARSSPQGRTSRSWRSTEPRPSARRPCT